jgi:hypothetical protein
MINWQGVTFVLLLLERGLQTLLITRRASLKTEPGKSFRDLGAARDSDKKEDKIEDVAPAFKLLLCRSVIENYYICPPLSSERAYGQCFLECPANTSLPEEPQKITKISIYPHIH